MSDEDRARWDRRHSERGPSTIDDIGLPAVFAPFAEHFPMRGRAVELACGSGTAAVWLARRGLDVWGCDVSPVAIAQARELAAISHCSDHCRFEVVDLDDGLPADEPVDVLLCNKFRDRRLYRGVVERLAAGGLLAISVLSEVGASPGSWRAGPGELVRAFSVLETLAAGEAHGEAWLVARRRG